MDYGIKVLEELIERIDSMPLEELKNKINEADDKFRKIQICRGEQIKIPTIQRDDYRETVFNSSATLDFSFRLAA